MFRTEFPIPPSRLLLNHHHQLLTLGSCFAEVTGNYLSQYKFKTLINPFGIIFNPISIFNQFYEESILSNTCYVEREGLWFHYNIHSSVYALTLQELKNIIEEKFLALISFLSNTNVLVLTFGTSWVYKLKSSGAVVANCHKMNSALFLKEILTPEDIVNNFTTFYNHIYKINPGISIILSISPVRHLKDTIPLNNLSKSILNIACHTITATFENVTYFPSYEIMLDDLRDYRFYREDMIHPTQQAENYIMQKFLETYMDRNTISIINKIKVILKALDHKPFHPSSPIYKQFLSQTIAKITELSGQLDFSKELSSIARSL